MRVRETIPAIGLATCSALPSGSPDEGRLAEALEALGARVGVVAWDDAATDWTRWDAVLVRSTWDYHLRTADFLGWLARLEGAGVSVWNRPHLIRWNAHKRYLMELGENGVPTVPTVWIPRGETVDVGAVMVREGWEEAVLKPAVAASAHGAVRLDRSEGPRRASVDLLLQPFLHEVTEGELSFVFFDGGFSHAVIKRPAPGEFRVQHEFGGSEEPVHPSAPLVAEAWRALEAAPGTPLVARVDMVPVDGKLLLMELELIEPAIFLGAAPGAADHLARRIIERLEKPHSPSEGSA